MNRYDRYPGDYLRDTLTLTLAQDGAYTRLLDYYYSKEHPIPDSEACMVTRARSKDDEDITHWVLRRFFRSEETGTELVWVHDRADREIAKARPRIQAARENGKRGGRPRKDSGNKDQSTGDKKPSGKPGGKPKQEPNENPGRKLPSPSPSPSYLMDLGAAEQRPKRPRKPKPAGPDPSAHRQVVDHYFATFERVRGCKPTFDGAEGTAVKNLLKKLGQNAAEACKVIDQAFASFRGDSVTIREIAKNPDNFRNLKPKLPKGQQPPQQHGSDVLAGKRRIV